MTDPHGLGQILAEKGWQTCSSLDMALTTLRQVNINEESVARAIGALIGPQGNTSYSNIWNCFHFVHALHIKNNNLQWELVYRYMDHAEFVVNDGAGMKLLFEIWSVACTNKPFPFQTFLQPWTHPRGQFSFLYHIVYSQGDLLMTVKEALALLPPVLDDIQISALHARLRSEATQLSTQPLNCLPLLQAIFDLYNTPLKDSLRGFIDRLTLETPELLMLGCSQLKDSQNELLQDTFLKLLNIFLIGHCNSSLVIILLWNNSSQCLLDGLLTLYQKDPATVSRILDVAQETKILMPILKFQMPYFTLDLASLAARRQHLNLEKWLLEELSTNTSLSVICLGFLEKKYGLQLAYQPHNGISNLYLSVDVIKIFFRVLADRPLPPLELAKFEQICQMYISLHPSLQSYVSTLTSNREWNKTPIIPAGAYLPEVEDLVRHHFERLYMHDLAPQDLVTLLKACRDSSDPRKNLFFTCLIETLMDESRFFDQYPDNELVVTGEVLGLLAKHRLLHHVQLRLLVQSVVDAVHQPVNSKLFHFGVQALLQFADRFVEWPHYALQLSHSQHLQAIPNLSTVLAATATFIQQEQHSGNLTNFSIGSPTTITTANHSQSDTLESVDGNSLSHHPVNLFSPQPTKKHLDKLGHTNIPPYMPVQPPFPSTTTPSTAAVDPVPTWQSTTTKLLHNLTIANAKQTADELCPLVFHTDATLSWFGRHLVLSHVSIEPDRHELYHQLLMLIGHDLLTELVLRETYTHIHLWIHAEPSSAACQSRISTMGAWLGKITLAKNKPIRHKDLPFKDLLLQAYEQDRLVLVILFCCQVLSRVTASSVFKVPNPWVVSLLKLLLEFYWIDNVEVSVKLMIERLFLLLKVNLDEFRPSMVVLMHLQTLPVQDGKCGSDNGAPDDSSLELVADGPHVPALNDLDITFLQQQLCFNAGMAEIMDQHPLIKALIVRAVSNVVLELIPGIISTSCNVAVQSCKMLLIKDFASEPDQAKLKQAAHAMIQPIVGQLALATCKAPLAHNLATSIRDYLTQLGLADAMADELSYSVTSDNLNIICRFVEQSAQSCGIQGIDRALSSAYTNRNPLEEADKAKHELFLDPLVHLYRSPSIQLPERLLPKCPLSKSQLDVYRGYLQSYDQEDSGPPVRDIISKLNLEPRQKSPPAEPLLQPASLPDVLDKKLDQLLTDMERLILDASEPSYSQLPSGHGIPLLMSEVRHAMEYADPPTSTVNRFMEKVVCLLYETPTQLGRDIYVQLLMALDELFDHVGQETREWLLYALDDRKFNVQVTYTLLQNNLLPPVDYDAFLGRLIRQESSGTAIQFAVSLLHVMLRDPAMPSFIFEDFILTISSLLEVMPRNNQPCDNIQGLVQQLWAIIGQPRNGAFAMRLLFAEWVRWDQIRPLHEHITHPTLATKMLETVNDDDSLCYFMRMATEVCVKYNMASPPKHLLDKTLTVMDSYAHLLSWLSSKQFRHANPSGSLNSTQIFAKATSIVILVLAHANESTTTSFNPLPYIRLFSSIYTEIRHHSNPDLLVIYSDALLTLEPKLFPGFAFGWLQLISCRHFVPQMLVPSSQDTQKLWNVYRRLVIAQLKFLGSLLPSSTNDAQPSKMMLSKGAKMFYRGCQRLLVSLLHDFPEFLCHYYSSFVQYIPPACVQLRNLILSAFPCAMQLPNPLSLPDMDDMPECHFAPTVDHADTLAMLRGSSLLPLLDAHLAMDTAKLSRRDAIFTMELLLRQLLEQTHVLRVDQHPSQGRHLLECVVLYLGLQSTQPKMQRHGFAVLAFQWLARHMDRQERHLLLCSLADHLRYPSSHTYFYTHVMMLLYEHESEEIKEQLVRVVFERLLVHRPHPWGLLALFARLVSRPSFWDHAFLHSSPEMEQLFSAVAKSVQSVSGKIN
ncbi:Not1-domain-containing protein [Hesseltinella vesiculosa]|uniref:Not1-domain-containing protein n=1 Tax=Hesseltinella vesiculosa TaxID=101127 RepID=A0A1X2G418_9FUNG|nr:Not1-domain-containing protein [Hesseltinella vesiculosa]